MRTSVMTRPPCVRYMATVGPLAEASVIAVCADDSNCYRGALHALANCLIEWPLSVLPESPTGLSQGSASGHFLPPLSSATSDCSRFVFPPFRSRRAHDRLCAMAQNLKRRAPPVTIAFDATADLRACPWFHLLQTPGTRETDSGDD